MGTVFNKKELLVLLQDFHCLTGLRSAVFDSYGIEVLAYPPELPAYCRLIAVCLMARPAVTCVTRRLAARQRGKSRRSSTPAMRVDRSDHAGPNRWCCCGLFAVEPHCTGGR